MGQAYHLAVDVGATKTLLAVFEAAGEMVCECKIATSHDYEEFKKDLAAELNNGLSRFSFSHCCIALPGWFDFSNDTALAFGNLPWKNVAIKRDLGALLPGVKVLYHNDAKLAGLSEAVLVQEKYKKILYVTISTGIGGGVVTNGMIDPDFAHFEPGQMILEQDGRNRQWEDLASGRALKARYGKLASEITNPAVWRQYAAGLVAGFENMLAAVQPDAVIIGGGVGAHFEKFQPYLEDALQKIDNPLVPTPPLLKARRPEEAVIYGCYEYIKQNL